MEDDAALVIQDAQVLFIIVLRVRQLFRGVDVLQAGVVLKRHGGRDKKKKTEVKRDMSERIPAGTDHMTGGEKKKQPFMVIHALELFHLL